MNRYWFEFDDNNLPDRINMGCGITAYNYEDALYLLCDKVFKRATLPKIKITIENVDVSTLDAGHILPNMLPPNSRGGVWFTLGYNL